MTRDVAVVAGALCLVVAGCATTRKTTPRSADGAAPPTAATAGLEGSASTRPVAEPALDRTAEVRRTYDRGFELVMQAVPTGSDDPAVRALEEIRRFRRQWVRWAAVKGSQYYSLEPGYRAGAWMAVVPPGHEQIGRMKGTLQIDAGEDVTALLIQPESTTELWAGILIVHELSHLADRVFGTESRSPSRREFLEGEFRAYYLELMAASLVADGALEQELDRIVRAWAPRRPAEIVELIKDMDPDDLAALDAAVGAGPPRSEAERGLRGGFYLMALVIRHSSREGLPVEDILDVIDQLYARPGYEADPRDAPS